MIEKTWWMRPRKFSSLNKSSFIKDIKVPKVQKYLSDNISSLNKVSTDRSSITIPKTRSRIGWILAIIPHDPIVSFWNQELICFHMLRKSSLPWVWCGKIGFLEEDKLFGTRFFDEYIAILESDHITWHPNYSFYKIFSLFVDMWSDYHNISSFRVTDVHRNEAANPRFHLSKKTFIRGIWDIIGFQIGKFIHEDIFSIMIAFFHGASINTKWGNDKTPNEEYDNEYDDQITCKRGDFSNRLIAFFEFFCFKIWSWFHDKDTSKVILFSVTLFIFFSTSTRTQIVPPHARIPTIVSWIGSNDANISIAYSLGCLVFGVS